MALKPFQIKFCCWNVLADVYSHSNSKHIDEDTKFLLWSNRYPKINKCIESSNADIFCLQEIDHFYDSYSHFFKSLDYTCIYHQRPDRQDGCLIAYKDSLFEVGAIEYINFDDIAIKMAGDHLRAANYEKKNVAILAHFKCKSLTDTLCSRTQKEFIVANTHIYWNPNKPKLKLAQTQYFIDRLIKFSIDNNLTEGIYWHIQFTYYFT